MTTFTVKIELEARNKAQVEKWLDKMGEALMIYDAEIIGEDDKHYEERIRYDENWCDQGEHFVFEGKWSDEKDWGLDSAFPLFDYDKDGYYYPVRVCNMVLAYNPEKYKKEEVPTSFKDFAYDQSFKGDLSMTNPLTSGTAYSSVVALLDKYGEDYFKALGKQDVAIESGSVALTKLETGECKAIMVLEESVLKKREEENSSLEVIYPEEGSIAIPSNIMIVDDKYSANNNVKACEAVEEFFLSSEGQELIVKGWMYGTKTDVNVKPYDGIELKDLVKQTLPIDWEKAYKDIEKIRKMFQENVTVPEK